MRCRLCWLSPRSLVHRHWVAGATAVGISRRGRDVTHACARFVGSACIDFAVFPASAGVRRDGACGGRGVNFSTHAEPGARAWAGAPRSAAPRDGAGVHVGIGAFPRWTLSCRAQSRRIRDRRRRVPRDTAAFSRWHTCQRARANYRCVDAHRRGADRLRGGAEFQAAGGAFGTGLPTRGVAATDWISSGAGR